MEQLLATCIETGKVLGRRKGKGLPGLLDLRPLCALQDLPDNCPVCLKLRSGTRNTLYAVSTLHGAG